MRGGDLDNTLAPGVGLRFEAIVRTDKGKLGRGAKAYLESIGRLHVNVFILTTGNSRKAAAFCYKWGIPYHRIIECAGVLEIPDVVREMDLLTYYDLDKNVLQNVNSRGHGKISAELWTQVED